MKNQITREALIGIAVAAGAAFLAILVFGLALPTLFHLAAEASDGHRISDSDPSVSSALAGMVFLAVIFCLGGILTAVAYLVFLAIGFRLTHQNHFWLTWLCSAAWAIALFVIGGLGGPFGNYYLEVTVASAVLGRISALALVSGFHRLSHRPKPLTASQ